MSKGLLEPAQETRYINDEMKALAGTRADADKVASSVLTVLRDHREHAALVDSIIGITRGPAP